MSNARSTLSQLNLPLLAALASVLTLAGCTSDVDNPPENGGELSVQVSALSASDIGSACYNISVTDGDGFSVWSQTDVCGPDYGAGTDIAYVGYCDADAPNHTVSLELAALYDSAGAEIPASEYNNPCPASAPCERSALCVANEDVAVDFDLTLLLDANNGFVDIAVGLEILECSAKLDCVDESGVPLDLLVKPNGQRGQTMVFGFSCDHAPCPIDPPSSYFSDLVVTCDEGTATVDTSNPGRAPISQTADILFDAFVYAGQNDGFATTFYWNVAIGFNGGTNCSVAAAATTSYAPFPGDVAPANYPVVSYNLELTDSAGATICTRHPLGGSPAGVEVNYDGGQDFSGPTLQSSDICEDCLCWSDEQIAQFDAVAASLSAPILGGNEILSNLPDFVGFFSGTTRSVRYAVSPVSGEFLAGLRLYDEGGQSYCGLFRNTEDADNPDDATWFGMFDEYEYPIPYTGLGVDYEERPRENTENYAGCAPDPHEYPDP